MKKTNFLLLILTIIVIIIAVIVTTNVDDITTLEEDISITETNLDYFADKQDNINRITYNQIVDLKNEYTMLINKQKVMNKTLLNRLEKLDKKVKSNSIYTREHAEDIFRLHNWYWEIKGE